VLPTEDSVGHYGTRIENDEVEKREDSEGWIGLHKCSPPARLNEKIAVNEKMLTYHLGVVS